MTKDIKSEFMKELCDIMENTDNEQTKCLAIIGLSLLSEIHAYDPNKEPEIVDIGKIKPLHQNQFSHDEQVLVGEPSVRRKEEN